MREHEVNQLNNFICGWYSDDFDLFDEIIDFHKKSDNKASGTSFRGVYSGKISTDVLLPQGELSNKYFQHLRKCLNLYVEKYPMCNFYAMWNVLEPSIIQHYLPNQGFLDWHTERCSAQLPYGIRHQVFMTYLNDVTDDGQTEFYHQNIKVKPEKGLTLIWPADWTFTHRGITSSTQEKYIITGWLSFADLK